MLRNKLLLTIIGMFLFTAIGSAQQTQTQCISISDPSGWVTVHISTDFTKCGGFTNDIKVIEDIATLTSGASLTACNDGTTLPTGWVITNFGTTFADCGSNTNDEQVLLNVNGMAIGTQETVCQSSPVPGGWTVINVGTDFGRCGGFSQDLKVIRRDA